MNITASNSPSLRVKAPNYSSNRFNITHTNQNVVINGGSATLVVVRDGNFSQQLNSTVRRDVQLIVTPVDAGSTDSLAFRSRNTAIAVVDSNGYVTRVSDGLVTIDVRANLYITKQVSVVVVQTGGNTALVPVSYVSGSLGLHLNNQIDGLIAGKVPSPTTQNIFVSEDHTNAVYVRNTSCIANLTGITALSNWNSDEANRKAGTLVSPRHIVFANHFAMGNGTTLRFVDASNNVTTRTITAQQAVSGITSGDICVGLLDSDVPSGIAHLKVLSSSVLSSKMPGSNLIRFGIFQFNQQHQAIVTDALFNDSIAVVSTFTPTNSNRLQFNIPIVNGDSGGAWCAVINGELILVCTALATNTGEGDAYSISAINSVMTSLGGGYQLTQYDLTSFPSY